MPSLVKGYSGEIAAVRARAARPTSPPRSSIIRCRAFGGQARTVWRAEIVTDTTRGTQAHDCLAAKRCAAIWPERFLNASRAAHEGQPDRISFFRQHAHATDDDHRFW